MGGRGHACAGDKRVRNGGCLERQTVAAINFVELVDADDVTLPRPQKEDAANKIMSQGDHNYDPSYSLSPSVVRCVCVCVDFHKMGGARGGAGHRVAPRKQETIRDTIHMVTTTRDAAATPVCVCVCVCV